MRLELSRRPGWLLPAGLLVLALLAFAKGRFEVPADLATYVSYADSYLDGRGLVSPSGDALIGTNYRALFIGLLALLQSLFGSSILSLAVLETVMAAAVTVSLYAATARLAGERPALLAAITFTLTPGVVYWYARHIDPSWTALVLAALCCWLTALEREGRSRLGWLLACGMVTAVSGRFKEMSLLFLLVPTAMAFLDAKGRGARDAAVVLAAALAGYLLLIAGLKAIGLWEASGYINDRFAEAIETRVGGWPAGGMLRAIWLLVEGIGLSIYAPAPRLSIASITPFWLLGVAALAALLPSAWRGDRVARTVLVLAIAFLPLSALAGFFNQRPVQNAILPATLYMAMGIVGCRLADWTAARLGGAVAPARIAAALGALLVVGQIGLDGENRKSFVRDSYLARLLTGNPQFAGEIVGSELAAWIRDNRDLVARHGDTLIATSIREQEGVTWYLDPPPRFVIMPFREVARNWATPYYAKHDWTPARPSILIVSFWRQPFPNVPVFALSHDALASVLDRGQGSLVVVRDVGVGRSLLPWLRRHFDVADVGEVGKRIKTLILRVKPRPAPVDRTVMVEHELIEYLEMVKASEPWRAERDRDLILSDGLGLSAVEIARLTSLKPVDGFVTLP